jgi:hypothetical protein
VWKCQSYASSEWLCLQSVSPASPRFHYRRLAFCFLPLAAILPFFVFLFWLSIIILRCIQVIAHINTSFLYFQVLQLLYPFTWWWTSGSSSVLGHFYKAFLYSSSPFEPYLQFWLQSFFFPLSVCEIEPRVSWVLGTHSTT